MENEPNFEQDQGLGGEIADVLRGYGDEHGFDSETCDEIAAMVFPDAFETAYDYLTRAGLDPDEVLTKFMEPPADT